MQDLGRCDGDMDMQVLEPMMASGVGFLSAGLQDRATSHRSSWVLPATRE